MEKRRILKILVSLIFIGLMISGEAEAIITNPTVTITNDANGDGIAGVGDTVTFSCRSNNASAGITPFVNLGVLGNPTFVLPNVSGNYYSAVFSISNGSFDNTSFNAQFSDNDSMVNSGNTIGIDSQPPNSLLGIVLDSSAAHGTGGEYIIGDYLKFTIDFSDADGLNGPPRLQVYADLNSFGLGTNVPLTYSGNGRYSFNKAIPSGRSGTAATFDLLAVDKAGNRKTYASSITYDTRVPAIDSVIASNTSGFSYIRTGDTVKITATVSNYNNETLTASNSILIPNSPVAMTRTGAATLGGTTTFEYSFSVPTGTNLDSSVYFLVTATSGVGNTSTRISNQLPVDTIPPIFAYSPTITIKQNGIVKSNNIAIIGDHLFIQGDLSSRMNSFIVTVDLSSIGGIANQLCSFNNDATTTFALDYTVPQYTSEDYSPRSFTIKAIDKAQNVAYSVTLPVIYVDNLPPSMTSVVFQKLNTTGTAKFGDTISLQANVTNLDGGTVWADLRSIGGNGSDVLSLSGANTYLLQMPVGYPAPGYSSVDSLKSFTVWAVDNSGNMTNMTSNGLYIDNEPPVILAATWTVTPPLSDTHPYVKIGDVLKFAVSLASSTSSIYDNQGVFMDLSSIGKTSNEALTFNGAGTYTIQVTVPSGTLNDDTTFSVIAKDNADNSANTSLVVHIDNAPPVPAAMTVNFIRDVAKIGTINLGDKLEFIVSQNNQDGGTCTIDLSMIGGPTTAYMNYDSSLLRYYLSYDTASTTIENSSYVFRANVTDKAGNSTTSLSKTFEVDCIQPVLNYASATFQNMVGNPNVINVGDRITVTAMVDTTRLHGGSPVVNLSPFGGSSVQAMFDDGAHNDGGANDGLYGYTFTVASGSLDGQNVALVVTLTDNCGNSVNATSDKLYVDNQPLVIQSVVATLSYDNNKNTICDLGGMFTTQSSFATDVIKLSIQINGNPWDFGQAYIDLTPLGFGTTNYQLTLQDSPGGKVGVASFSPIPGTTHRQNTSFNITVVDVNGNVSFATSTPQIMIDNLPPSIQVYPISFVTDNGRLGEANQGDVIQIKVRLDNHDGILPQIDFTNLYLANGMTPPSPTLFPPGGPNEYTYNWNVPAGLGSIGSLTILAFNSSGNMAVGYTNEIRFLSNTPSIKGFPSSRADLTMDTSLSGYANQIANPGDQVTLTCVLNSAYNAANTPPATVLADIRTITQDPSDDSSSAFYDGNPNTYWAQLSYLPPPVSGSGNFVYMATFTVGVSRQQIAIASFPVKVLHPDVYSITMASSTLICDSTKPFAIDTLVPNIVNSGIFIASDSGDNLSPGIANIGDTLTVFADIKDYSDPGSVSVQLLSSTSALIDQSLMQLSATSTHYVASFMVSTYTVGAWTLAMQGNSHNDFPRYSIRVTDKSENLSTAFQVATFSIDNLPPQITNYQNLLIPGHTDFPWVAHVGSGVSSDSIVAQLTCDFQPYDAFIDLSPIQGSSSWPITFPGSLSTGRSQPFLLSTPTIDLATFTFPIRVRDQAGNVLATYTQLAVDTTRPKLTQCQYDGQRLYLIFSEALNIYPLPLTNWFDFKQIRIGNRNDLSGNPPDASYTIQFSADDTLEDPGGNSNRLSILISMDHRRSIADWGSSPLWLSMGSSSFNGESVNRIGCDLAGNWVIPLIQNPATMTVNVPSPYAIKPNLSGGWYDAVNLPGELHLQFDKDMDLTTYSDNTISGLAVVKTRSTDSLPADYTKRYTIRPGNETSATISSNKREVIVRLSPEAQDWIAMKYQHTGASIYYSVATNPTLIRDINGNRLKTITNDLAVAASLTPVVTSFNINNGATLDINSGILNISCERRMRLFLDEMQVNSPFPSGRTISNVAVSKVFLYNTANQTGLSLALSTASVPASSTTTPPFMMNDYTASSVNILLSTDEIRTILSWNTSTIYLGVTQGAFKDLWDNQSNAYPLTGTTAMPVSVTFPSSYSGPKLVAAALSTHTPVKSATAGSLFYEIELQTATISPNISVPVDRSILPYLTINRQDDNSVCDIGSFVVWSDRVVNGVTRTVARYANTQPYSVAQSIPVYMNVTNCFDVFGKAIDPNPSVASYVFNTADRITSGNGFSNQSQPFVIDSMVPTVVSVQPTGVIGRTPVNSALFIVTFSEAMDQSQSFRPTLRLGDTNNTVMNFGFESWLNASQARFFNTSDFNDNSSQGSYTYYVSGGYDLAGNVGANNVAYNGGMLEIRSHGPVISQYTITTYPSTTAKFSAPTGYVTGKPFSPYVSPGLATITVTYSTTPSGPNWLNFYQGNASIGSVPISIVGNTGTALWDGTLNGSLIGQTGPVSYEMRVYDMNANEGSIRGTIVYDGQSPTILSWLFTHARTSNGTVYFSPKVHSYVKIDALGIPTGQNIFLRVNSPGLSTDTYTMSALSGGGYTLSFDGKSTDSGAPVLPDGQYLLNVVDAAGNLGIPLGPTSVATGTLIIRNTDPQISSLQTFRTDNASQTTRFNPRVTSLTIQATTGDPAISSGTVIARILSGATVIRDLPMGGVSSTFTSIWDGTDSNGKIVPDGAYRVTVVDQAENPSSLYVDLTVSASAFQLTSALQIDSTTVRLIFSQDVNVSDASNLSNYSITPNDPAGLGFVDPATVNGKMVDLVFNVIPTNQATYTITVAPGFRSIDDDPIVSGNNVARFSPDTQAPLIQNITFNGITNSRQFNVIFNEKLDTVSAGSIGNYTLVTGTQTVPLASITVLTDNKTVEITALADILQTVNYTLYASGVRDLFKNPSDPSLARFSFKGMDVTPPILTVSAFSNPADEYDISIAVMTNEALSEPPAAVITQSGGNSSSLVLNVGPTNILFLGGGRLDKNFPGNATIQVKGKDLAGNTATVNIAFTLAYVNASMRTSILSADKKFSFVFPQNSLTKNSIVSIVPDNIIRDNPSANLLSASSRIRAAIAQTKRNADIKGSSGDELAPVTGLYYLNVPDGRLKGSVEVNADVTKLGDLKGVGLFSLNSSGKWEFVSREVKSGKICGTTGNVGAFALLRDTKSPSIKMLSKIEPGKMFRDERPTFEWFASDLGTGVDPASLKVILDKKSYEGTFDSKSGNITFQPIEPLANGYHDIYLVGSDKAGNIGISEAIRFLVKPNYNLSEIAIFPNPARDRAVLRIGTNRDDVFGDLVNVDIYDVSGKKVKSGDELRSTNAFDGQRQTLDLTWDLTNDNGKKVANGVYLVKVTVHDPDNYEKKTKVTKKIAVLR
ncbi:MAG: hypothetical protein HQM08_00915 [Candidatus Riflebacteria bacterium]|nr:hypothetical protein [Candidatus Riflebacteria bacterium]